MKNCKTCKYHHDISKLCLLHSTYGVGNLLPEKYQQVDGINVLESKMEFLGTEMIAADDDFGCSQHKSYRDINSLTNDEFLIASGEKMVILEDYKFNKKNYTEEEYIRLKKEEFIKSLVNPYTESEKFYFSHAVEIYNQLEKLGININLRK
jgi:hypothetical protein